MIRVLLQEVYFGVIPSGAYSSTFGLQSATPSCQRRHREGASGGLQLNIEDRIRAPGKYMPPICDGVHWVYVPGGRVRSRDLNKRALETETTAVAISNEHRRNPAVAISNGETKNMWQITTRVLK